jgi:hypothetical protein
MGFIYLIHVREFLHKNECVYKIGRTDHLLQRITQYPKGSKLLFCMNVNDCQLAERDLLNLLARQQKIRVDIGAEYIEGVLDSILQTMFTYIQRHNSDSDIITTTVDAIGSRKVDPSILIMDFINGRKDELAGKSVKSRELYDQLQQWMFDNDHHVFISHVKMSRELTRLYGVGHKVCRFDTGVDQAICFSTLTCDQETETTNVFNTHKKDDRNVLLLKFLKNVWKVHHEKESEIIGSTKLFEQFLLFCSNDIGQSHEQTKKWNLTLFARCIGNLAKDSSSGIDKYKNYGPKRLCVFEFHMQKLNDYINSQLLKDEPTV